MKDYGLTEKKLRIAFQKVLKDKEPGWNIKGLPEVQFYKDLHLFLKRWPVSYKTTKQAIAKFYCALDPNLKAMGYRLDNTYRFIEKVCESKEQKGKVMSYNRDDARVLKVVCSEASSAKDRVSALSSECEELKEKFQDSQKQLSIARKALTDVTNKCFKLDRQYKTAKAKSFKLRHDLEDVFSQMEDENLELSTIVF